MHLSNVPDENDTGLETHQYGVYNVYLEKSTEGFLGSFKELNKWRESLSAVSRLITEVYELAPALFIIYCIARVSKEVESVVLLHYETRILRIIETGLSQGTVDPGALFGAILARLVCVLFTSALWYSTKNVQSKFRARTMHYFDDCLLAARLSSDLTTDADNLSDEHLSAQAAWSAVVDFIDVFSRVFALMGQFGYVVHIGSSSNYGSLFVLFCLAGPFLRATHQPMLWIKPRVVEATNTHFLRMKALRTLSEKRFRSDVISANITQFVIKQFRTARIALGDTDISGPEVVAGRIGTPWINEMLYDALGDLPIVFSALLALLRPKTTSLSTIASLHESSNLLRQTFWDLFYTADEFLRRIGNVQQFYEFVDREPKVKDGEMIYPLPSDSGKSCTMPEGMAIELRNVSFSYPGDKDADTKALDDVSFSISPGQLVVIVGANGSGKSSIIKLITRLYDVATGSILIDGEDIQNFQLQSLRQAMATLTQDHHLYPLSLAENIGLGYVEAMNDTDLIHEAAQKGCATDIIEKLSEKMETVLDPQGIQYSARVDHDGKNKLYAKLKSLSKSKDVSGGERQRLVAARTFMRFNSGKIKLVAVDEPSSALDAKAELTLFDNLRSAREGKSMIFVTHRFGHLTKHADKILCMSKGRVVESGTHAELMQLKGEYFKLYNIQAEAFQPEEK
ncbi:hypothetical protein D9758_002932 [Tetrapyrgos nigripes]|uniref:ABC transporter domain-containing protein n=1 Tax=Tetrapyrgos nigripes TaxID=182062 RepID=A0A8H5LTG4_9AGAR|nr:hypothetical protein D9758_002932 [Tetrapyrgos nigripes]